MNGAVHYLFSALITLGLFHLFSRKEDESTDNLQGKEVVFFVLVFITNFFFHTVVDGLARFTYHPSESSWQDPVYLIWHLSTYIAEAVFAIWLLKTDLRYFWGMLGAVGFDIWDWSISRPLYKISGINMPGLHWMADWMEKFLFGWAVSLRQVKLALLVEIIAAIILTLSWLHVQSLSSFTEEEQANRWRVIIIIVITIGSLRLLTLY